MRRGQLGQTRLELLNCWGQVLFLGVPSEGWRILTGGSPVMVEAGAM
jgi:hypothetical protein